MSKVPPVVNSLVKYDTPVLVSEAKKKQKPLDSSTPTKKGGKKLPPVENKPTITQAEDILNSILPPRLTFCIALISIDNGKMVVDYGFNMFQVPQQHV
jgi:hypothetical protein